MAAATATLMNTGPSTIMLEGPAAVSKAREQQAKHERDVERINHRREIEVGSKYCQAGSFYHFTHRGATMTKRKRTRRTRT